MPAADHLKTASAPEELVDNEASLRHIPQEVRQQIVIKLNEAESKGESGEKQKWIKRTAILDNASRYLKDIETVRLEGNLLRPTQKMAAIGFQDWIQRKLFDLKLMGHLVHPVGTGKTNVAIMLGDMAGGHTFVVAHNNSTDILENFFRHQETLPQKQRRTVGQCFGGKNEVDCDLMVAHFQSSHLWLPALDWHTIHLIVVDEADINALSVNRHALLEQLSEKYGIPIVGMSATEEQASGKKLQDVFPDRISRLSMPDALPRCLEMGITPEMIFSDLYLDLDMQLDTRDFKQRHDIPDESVDEFIRSTAWIQLILNHYVENFKKDGKLKPGMIVFRDNLLVDYCVGQAKKRGLRAAAYTGELDDVKRIKLQKQLREGELDLLVGSKLIGRGLHIPEVEVVYNSTITWSPQLFWQADGRGASIDEDNLTKVSHIIAVLPKTMLDKVTGRLLPPERKPLCHATFFDPDYFEGDEDRLVNLDTEEKPDVFLKRSKVTDHKRSYSFNLADYEVIRSIEEVARITKGLREKPVDFVSRGVMIARLIDSLEDKKITISFIRWIIHYMTKEIRDLTAAIRIGRIEKQGQLDAAVMDNRDGTKRKEKSDDDPGSVRYLTTLADSAPLLTRGEEIDLLVKIEAGDAEAKKILIHAYLPLIISLAKHMHVAGFDLSDFIHEGVIGLLQILKTLEKIRGSLSGYVLVMGYQRIQRIIEDGSRDIRLPTYVWQDAQTIFRTRDRMSSQILNEGGIPLEQIMDAEIAEEFSISTQEMMDMFRKALKESNDFLRIAEIYHCLKKYLYRSSAVIQLDGYNNYWGERGANYNALTLEQVANAIKISVDELFVVIKMKSQELQFALRFAYVHSKMRSAEVVRKQIQAEYQRGERPTLEQAGNKLGLGSALTQEKVVAYLQREVVFDEENPILVTDAEQVTAEDLVVTMALAVQTRKVLASLTPREEKVLRMRFGVGEKQDHTLEEISQDFEVNKERIRQIEVKALRKLRHPSRSKRLAAFLEK